MANKKYAFIPLSINNSDMAIQNEFMIDYDGGELYINDMGSPKMLRNDEEKEYIDIIMDRIFGDRNMSLSELSYIVAQIGMFKDEILESSGDMSLDHIYSIVKDLIDSNINLKDLLDSKITEDGVLSDNDFTDSHLSKLNSIDKYANFYEHPDTPVCGIKFVKSINGKVGDATITSEDIGGLDIADQNANRYVHPHLPECNLYDKGVSFINGRRGEVILNKDMVGLYDMKDMGLNNTVSQYIPLTIDSDGYATPKSTNMIMNFYIVDIPKPVKEIYSLTESLGELGSSMYFMALAGMLKDGTPFIYSNITGYIGYNTIRSNVSSILGGSAAISVTSISNKGIGIKRGSNNHMISVDRSGSITVDQTNVTKYEVTATDTGIYYLSNNEVVARSYIDYSKLGYITEDYAIRGGSYKYIAESINHNGRGIISIASDHEIFFAFVDGYGTVRAIFTNGVNRYTHSNIGGIFHDL